MGGFSFSKKTFSAKEVQRQLGHNRYQPIWHMLHKLRKIMGSKDGEYILAASIELDEGFFSTEVPESQKKETIKRGRGSQKKSKVLVMAESEYVGTNPKGKPRRVGYLKMKVIENLKKETINECVQKLMLNVPEIISDASNSYVELKDFVAKHTASVVHKDKVGEQLP